MIGSGKAILILRLIILLLVFLPPVSSHARINKGKILSYISRGDAAEKKIGIVVRSANTGKTLFRLNGQKKFIPASNNKILSSVAALSILGKDYRFKTEFYLGGGIHSGTGHGGLYVKGFGDPTIDLEELRKIAAEIKSLGITKIDGGIYLDGSYFDDIHYGKGWDPRWFGRGFCPPVTAISFNYNTVKVKLSASGAYGRPARVSFKPAQASFPVRNETFTSKRRFGVSAKFNERNELYVSGYVSMRRKSDTVELSVPDPFLYFGSVLKRVFEQRGIEVSGEISRRKVPKWAGRVFTHYSQPLSDILREYNKESVNIIGESIVKVIGARFSKSPGSWENGTYVIGNHLREIGINGNFSIADGSGLSRLNRASPEGITEVLQKVYKDPRISTEFLASLPVAGVDGTLKERFRNLRGSVYAKTGYLEGARSLSGYAFSKDGQVYVFSIISNGMGARVRKLQKLLLQELVY